MARDIDHTASGMTEKDLPPLRDIIARYKLSARKPLGQSFLLDMNLTRRIVRAAGDITDTTVIEIGPGPGGLTRALLETGASRVIAVELDRRCICALNELQSYYPDRLHILEQNALEVDISRLSGQPVSIIANLPYNIATPLLLKWLKNIYDDAKTFRGLTLMFQKEVAARLVANTHSKAYGRLSVITQWLCQVGIAFDVNPKAFVPPPKVQSTVVHLAPRPGPLVDVAFSSLETITAFAFGQRRKMLRSSLKRLNFDLAGMGIDPTKRAENLSLEEFCRLAQKLEETPSSP